MAESNESDMPITSQRARHSPTIGLFGAIVFAVMCVSLASTGIRPLSIIAGVIPGTNLILLMSIVGIACLFLVYSYAAIGSSFPFNGSDYILSTRTLGGFWGFASSWIFVVFGAILAGMVAAMIPQGILPSTLIALGKILNIDSIAQIGKEISSQGNIVIVGTIVIVLAFWSCIYTSRLVFHFLEAGFVLGILAFIVISIQLLTAAPGSFPGSWDQFMGQGNYIQTMDTSRNLGIHYILDPGLYLQGGLFMGFFLFAGFFSTVFIAGEIKRPEQSILISGVITIVLILVLAILSILMLQRLLPLEWASSESFLFQVNAKGFNLPWLSFYAAAAQPNFALVAFVGLTWTFLLFNLIQTYLYFCSKVLLAWGKDQLLPKGFDYVHPRFQSPIIALLIISIVALMGLLGASGRWGFYSQLTMFFFMTVSQLIPILSITLFPFIRPEWFNQAPRLVTIKLGPVPLVSITGFISLIILLAVILSLFLFPISNFPILKSEVLFPLMIIGIGIGWYIGWTFYQRRKGKNLKTRFRSLPEDS